MGQALPLPERIPLPKGEVRTALTDAGIVLLDAKENMLFVSYTLPAGWKMVDNSTRQDLPLWYMIDDAKRIRFVIQGVWKETYDNKLSIYIGSSEPFVPRVADLIIPSETSLGAMSGRLGEMLDPLGRPAAPLSAHRSQPFVPPRRKRAADASSAAADSSHSDGPAEMTNAKWARTAADASPIASTSPSAISSSADR